MQNKYVGDVGDFGKYGLLRALCGADQHGAELRLGVVWYLVPDEKGGDGGHTAYLTRPEKRGDYHPCDEKLYDALAAIVDPKGRGRKVASIRERGILPRGTAFHERELTFNAMPAWGSATRDARLEHRKDWLRGALEATSSCGVVFTDPDNGLEVKSCRCYNKRGPKYVFFDELAPFVDRRQSLIIYQHIDHSRPAEDQTRRRLSQLEDRLTGCATPFGLLYHRGTARAFLVVPSKDHNDTLLQRARRFLEGSWSALGHFDSDLIWSRSSPIR